MGLLLGVQFITLITAAIWDLRFNRIPNWLTGTATLLGLLLWYWISGLEGSKTSALGFGVGLVVFLIPYVLGGMGGGDVKLTAAVGALVGWPLIIWVALLSCVVALFATVAKSIWQGAFLKLLANTYQITRNTFVAVVLRRPCEEIRDVTRVVTAARVPFGAAVALGTAWAMLLQWAIDQGMVDAMPYLRGY